MTIAEQYIEAWHSQTKTIGARDLARRVDQGVNIERRTEYPTGYTFIFSDKSAARTEGKGQSFKLMLGSERR